MTGASYARALLLLCGGIPITAKTSFGSTHHHQLGFVPSLPRKDHVDVPQLKSRHQAKFSGKHSCKSYLEKRVSSGQLNRRVHDVPSTSICSSREHQYDIDSWNNEFDPDSLIERLENTSTSKPVSIFQQLAYDDDDETLTSDQACIQRRQFLLASSAIWASLAYSTENANALDPNSLPVLTEKVNYQQSPINKRSGVTLRDAERTYPENFVTYLSRFLLVFDDECQQWWYTQAQAIPPKSSKEEVESIRLIQFGQFAASVEVGLIDFEGDGVPKLLDSLVKRFGPISVNKSALTDYDITEREIRKSKEALRQIALLFSLLGENQPVDRITQILAADDDARIVKVEMLDGGAGYPPPAYTTPDVIFPDPPTLDTDFGGSTATGTAIMKESGGILKVELIQGGRGYLNPPTVEISYPPNTNDGDGERVQATAQATLGKKKNKGSVEQIEIVVPGRGYNSLNDITVTISPPESSDGVPARAKSILEYQVAGVNITEAGCGYAAEKPINIVIDPPPGAARGKRGSRSAFAAASPVGKSTSYESFLGSDSDSFVSAAISDVDTSQWVAGPSSGQLVKLLPSGFGLQYDIALERYILSRSTTSNNWDDILGGSLEGQTFKAINPIFGFRGRSPIEKEKNVGVSQFARFAASGAICSSVAHLLVTPIDVVKTKVQTKPDVYNKGIVGTFKDVLAKEGAGTFFDGWEPTTVGYFFGGALAFAGNEFFKRYYTSLATSILAAQSSMSDVAAATAINSFEIPLILASAASAAFFCCFVLAPFDAVRIRTVSQPDYADNSVG